MKTVLKKLDAWTRTTGFKFSVDKTKAIVFYKNKRWIKDHAIQLKLGGNTIPIVNQHKFLGIILDKHLNFEAHIEYIRTKCKKSLNLIKKKLANTNWGVDRKSLKLICKTTTLAILDYGCHVYGSATKPVLRRLDPIHNEGLRLVTGAFRSSPTVSVQVDSGEPPLELHREKVIMTSKLRLQHNHSPLNQLFDRNDVFWKPD